MYISCLSSNDLSPPFKAYTFVLAFDNKGLQSLISSKKKNTDKIFKKSTFMICCKETLAVLITCIISFQVKGIWYHCSHSQNMAYSCINCTEINLEIINNLMKLAHLFKEYILYINLNL